MSKSTKSDTGPCFYFESKKHNKDRVMTFWFYVGLMLSIFFEQGRRAVKAGHYASCQEVKEEIKVTA